MKMITTTIVMLTKSVIVPGYVVVLSGKKNGS